MIEVTDEMITKVGIYFNTTGSTTPDDRVWLSGAIKLAIELHEANKPKPEPVGYVKTVGGYPDESEHRAEWVVKYKELKDGQPLYTTPPTREPLSAYMIISFLRKNESFDELFDDGTAVKFARAIEQAHGIGTSQTTT